MTVSLRRWLRRNEGDDRSRLLVIGGRRVGERKHAKVSSDGIDEGAVRDEVTLGQWSARDGGRLGGLQPTVNGRAGVGVAFLVDDRILETERIRGERGDGVSWEEGAAVWMLSCVRHLLLWSVF